MDARIREATTTDARAVGLMHLAAWREAYGALLPGDVFADDAEARWVRRWEGNLAQRDADVVLRIAERDGAVVGLATAGPGRANYTAGPPVRAREVWALYVRASEYGSGLAARLLEAVLAADVPAELGPTEPVPARREAV